MEKELVKQTALAVSLAILEARWNDLDQLLDKNFTYTGDGFRIHQRRIHWVYARHESRVLEFENGISPDYG